MSRSAGGETVPEVFHIDIAVFLDPARGHVDCTRLGTPEAQELAARNEPPLGRERPTAMICRGLSLFQPNACAATLRSHSGARLSFSASSWMTLQGPSSAAGVVGGGIATHCAARRAQGGLVKPGGGQLYVCARNGPAVDPACATALPCLRCQASL
ncbi:hypothetical protein PHLGIDRAFT_123235 [Phlebiopsis gigantea 11061_1 CR5-6]|uniref:Uncharacterized protein n=1 Tax=Phlebiopsis gigantea (strain 11061_1 CR5-6) TaxID=745531 RepID=A0A0C3S201_PHLG1|nr:hypothetical protein PHLGIDRAFT_123235 [Phlebiopsis gigantea 11061_1 CR5-6]